MEDFNEGVDGKLASRMRRVNPEQFFTLVKMHLSFELDINTDNNDPVTDKAKLKRWSLLNFSKKPKSMMNLQQKTSESGSLTLEGISQVKQLIKYLSKEQCICQEGIFRRTGKLTRQQELKSSLYQGLPLKLEDGTYSVHDCASVLKGFLAELPEPLLTELHYPVYCQIAELCYSNLETNESRLIRPMQLLLLLMPSVNRILLKYLLNLLNKTATFESNNKMNCDTLATLFTPHLMCPRNLSPEALHINSQSLSGLVALMIKKDRELFEIPPKLATDIRVYWVEQERKLLSPSKNKSNESESDTTGTAHTVFSFVDHKLTAKAKTTDDTQSALAELYAHIQAMPESAKKRRLVKQFNKENGQGTPHVKQIRTKSLSNSIKKHIFPNKLLGNKKLDINIGYKMLRSSSEENTLSNMSPSKQLFSKSDDELSINSFAENEHFFKSKRFSNDIENIDNSNHEQTKKDEGLLKSGVYVRGMNHKIDNDCQSPNNRNCSVNLSYLTKLSKSSTKTNPDVSSEHQNKSEVADRTVRRYHSEPLYMSGKLDDENQKTIVHRTRRPFSFNPIPPHFEIVFTPQPSPPKAESHTSLQTNDIASTSTSPMIKNKCLNVFGAHTSTPSNLLHCNLIKNEHGLTPIAIDDKSMSPITRSTTKMTKAMQEAMMTPRSRKPVVMISATNLCNLATTNKNGEQKNTKHQRYIINIDIDEKNSLSTTGKSPKNEKENRKKSKTRDRKLKEKKENIRRSPLCEHNFNTSIDPEDSVTSTFKEYLLSRSVLTASPVDLSFTSRTGDFEQSESDLNILDKKNLSDSLLQCLNGNHPSSDTSGIGSGIIYSANNSAENIDDTLPSQRKRSTNIQRNDFKRSVKSNTHSNEQNEQIIQKSEKNLNESNLSNINNSKDFQETCF